MIVLLWFVLLCYVMFVYFPDDGLVAAEEGRHDVEQQEAGACFVERPAGLSGVYGGQYLRRVV